MMKRCILAAMILLFARGVCAADFCYECHLIKEGTSLKAKNDVHHKNSLSCADCHGGDRAIDDMNRSKVKGTGFSPRPTRRATPDFCGRCHSDATFMAKYIQKVVNQLELYKSSVHGKALAAGKKSAECVDCHSVHNTRAVSDPLSTANPKLLATTCGKCHKEVAAAFRKGPHDDDRSCLTCHAAHDTQRAAAAMFTSPSGCPSCHEAASEGGEAAAEIAQLLAKLEAAGPAGKDALARARVAMHTCDAAAVKRAAETATNTPKATEK